MRRARYRSRRRAASAPPWLAQIDLDQAAFKQQHIARGSPPGTGGIIRTCRLALTGESSERHDRHHQTKRIAPVILPPRTWPLWIAEQLADVPQFKAVLAPYPASDMICWPVSTRVHDVKNNDPTLIAAVATLIARDQI
jgi:hypothetical protein